MVASLLAVAFNVFPLTIPDGLAVQLSGAYDEGRWPVCAPPPTVSMNENGETVLVVSRRGTAKDVPGKTGVLAPAPQGQRLVIFRSHSLRDVIMPPSGAVFASQPFGAPSPLDERGQPIFKDLQVANALVSDAGILYVTLWHYFDGAYSGTALWSFDREDGSWRPVPALKAMARGLNLIVTASADQEQIGYVVDYEAAGNYVGSDAQSGLTDRDEAWVTDGKSQARLGNGRVTAVSKHRYVGFDSHFFPAPPNFVKAPDAFEWAQGRTTDLGHGLAWAINKAGVIVGDNRLRATALGQPLVWYGGKRIPLTSLAGSAFSINDRNEIVGDIASQGGFLARIGDRGPSLELLDHDLTSAARGWHIAHAYAIDSHGSILAVGKTKNGTEQMVLLVPDQ
jgi:hypothetical protein